MSRIAHSYIFRCILIGGLIFATVILLCTWRLGSLPLALAYIEGERFVVSPIEIDLGECDSKTHHVAQFVLTNLTTKPIRIVGSKEGCNCLRLDELPITVGPRENQDISIQVFVSGKEEYSQTIILYLDDDGLRSVALRIRAKVRQVKSVAGRHAFHGLCPASVLAFGAKGLGCHFSFSLQ
jgi:hypothetical protein